MLFNFVSEDVDSSSISSEDRTPSVNKRDNSTTTTHMQQLDKQRKYRYVYIIHDRVCVVCLIRILRIQNSCQTPELITPALLIVSFLLLFVHCLLFLHVETT